MNYIRHLNAFFTKIRNDENLTAIHVSLYMALFQYWNFNRFQNPFPVYRDNIMQLSRIGSKNTYHKCIKHLHHHNYIIYHPAPSRYLPVKISVIRLDLKAQQPEPKQLLLFSDPSPQDGCNQAHVCEQTGAVRNSPFGLRSKAHSNGPDKVTNGRSADLNVQGKYHQAPLSSWGGGGGEVRSEPHVPNLTGASLTNDTQQVPELGRTIKQANILKNSVQHPPTKNQKKQDQKHKTQFPMQVPFLRHTPELAEVEAFFREQYRDVQEARKFYYYNQSKNWMLTDKIPVYNWQALAQKWMLNERQADSLQLHADIGAQVQFLYEKFLSGEKVNKLIFPEYADHLQLAITDTLWQQAWQRRINQLSGSNEASEVRLWQAYMTGNTNDELLIHDQPNLLALAKRLALVKHFQKLKSKNIKNIGSNDDKVM